MRIAYNAPFVLSFALVAVSVMLYNTFVDSYLIPYYFTLQPYFDYQDPLSYVRLFSYAIGHANLEHLMENFTYMLLIGPYLEEKYGSKSVFVMAMVTAIITSLLYLGFVMLYPLQAPAGILGASGIVFMMILLGSFTNVKSGYIPLTFVFILVFFMGTQILNAFEENQISEFAHIVGGICGSIFGFVKNKP